MEKVQKDQKHVLYVAHTVTNLDNVVDNKHI